MQRLIAVTTLLLPGAGLAHPGHGPAAADVSGLMAWGLAGLCVLAAGAWFAWRRRGLSRD